MYLEHETMWEWNEQNEPHVGWYDNGQKKFEYPRREGKMHGFAIWWWEDGQKKKEIYFIHTKPYGWMEWSKEGNLISATFHEPPPPLPTYKDETNSQNKKKSYQEKVS